MEQGAGLLVAIPFFSFEFFLALGAVFRIPRQLCRIVTFQDMGSFTPSFAPDRAAAFSISTGPASPTSPLTPKRLKLSKAKTKPAASISSPTTAESGHTDMTDYDSIQGPMPWLWACHKCNSRYPLGATRRCLHDGKSRSYSLPFCMNMMFYGIHWDFESFKGLSTQLRRNLTILLIGESFSRPLLLWRNNNKSYYRQN